MSILISYAIFSTREKFRIMYLIGLQCNTFQLMMSKSQYLYNKT